MHGLCVPAQAGCAGAQHTTWCCMKQTGWMFTQLFADRTCLSQASRAGMHMCCNTSTFTYMHMCVCTNIHTPTRTQAWRELMICRHGHCAPCEPPCSTPANIWQCKCQAAQRLDRGVCCSPQPRRLGAATPLGPNSHVDLALVPPYVWRIQGPLATVCH